MSGKEHVRESFPYKLPLRLDQLLDKIKSGTLFGYVQCDIKVPDHLGKRYAIFPPVFKNTNVCRQDIGPLLLEYAARKGLMSTPWRMLPSSFELINGTTITALILFYLNLRLKCTKNCRFNEYTPAKCFNTSVQTGVNARRQGDENPNSSFVAETMKLLANSSFGYQITDRSRHSVFKHTNNEKKHAAINNKMFMSVGYINDQLYEVELAKSEMEYKEPILVGFFILRYAKLRLMKLKIL